MFTSFTFFFPPCVAIEKKKKPSQKPVIASFKIVGFTTATINTFDSDVQKQDGKKKERLNYSSNVKRQELSVVSNFVD